MSRSFEFQLVLKGVLITTLLALILSVGFSLLLSLTSIPESTSALNFIFALSVLVGSLIISHQAGRKGLIYGLAVGLGFMILLLILSAVFESSAPSWLNVGEKAIFALVAGGIGGIVGVMTRR